MLAGCLLGQNAVRRSAGFGGAALDEGDSVGSPLVLIGFNANFYGRDYSAVSVNSDGMVTLGVINASYRYVPLRELAQPGIAPFWSDGFAPAGSVTYGRDTLDGRAAFAATWNGVRPFAAEANPPRNVFQLVLIDRSDTGAGNFDFEFNYESIAWECSLNNRECVNGVGFAQARAGWTTGLSASTASAFEIDGSNEAGIFLDSNALALGLKGRSMDSNGVVGRMVFQVRNGIVQNAGRLPQISSIVNAASFVPSLAANSFFTIFGTNLATIVGPWDKFVRNGVLPTSIRSLRVRINGQDAYISYFSPGQLNVLAPPGSYTDGVDVEVSNGLGTSTRQATVNRVSPGWFGYRQGQRFYPSTSNPCKAGEPVAMYGTGFGATTPQTPAGQVLGAAYPIDNPNRIRVVLGGVTARVLFVGMTFAGAWQVNIQVPEGLGSGDLPLRLEVDGVLGQEAFLNCSN